jgi:hypothetical protein
LRINELEVRRGEFGAISTLDNDAAMVGPKAKISNFSHLAVHDEQLARLGALAEHYFPSDPNTCLLKLRQFGELGREKLFIHPALVRLITSRRQS